MLDQQRIKISVRQVLGNVFVFYLDHFASLVFLFAILAGPFILASSLLSSHIYAYRLNYELAQPEQKLVHLGFSFLNLYIAMLVSGLGYHLFVGAIVLRKSMNDGISQDSSFNSLFPAYRRIGAIFVLGAIVELIMFLGGLLLIVPGIILWLRYSVSVPAMISENIGITRAMQRSKTITRGNKLRILLVLIVISVVSIILSYVPHTLVRTAFSSNGFAFEAFNFAINSIIGPLVSLGIVFLYYELKIIEQNKQPKTDMDMIQQPESTDIGHLKQYSRL
ncbi:MAG: glycerophosphoryl diester phosphodiesterase membrane domain-containing protein [Phycisphaerae bacterium]|nr:glycerophosphoryl diester phosphodiesterase membrane domain-containing protein [Phycisphaerae bacterium]